MNASAAATKPVRCSFLALTARHLTLFQALQEELENRKNKKISKQVRADGTRLAPWMTIDEDRVDAQREARRENKRKTGKVSEEHGTCTHALTQPLRSRCLATCHAVVAQR